MSFRVRVSVRFGIGNLIVDPCGRKTPVILECKCDNVDFNLLLLQGHYNGTV